MRHCLFAPAAFADAPPVSYGPDTPHPAEWVLEWLVSFRNGSLLRGHSFAL